MGDPKEAIDAYATAIDLTWLGAPPTQVVRGTIVSADQDLDPARLDELRSAYHAVAADWESGAIAHVAALNHTRVLILRGVSASSPRQATRPTATCPPSTRAHGV